MSGDPSRTRGVPKAAVATGIAATFLVVVGAGAALMRSSASMHDLAESELHIRRVAGDVMRLDEVLTMSARMAVATGDPVWEERYRRHEPELDRAIKEIIVAAPEAFVSEAAKDTDRANAYLVAMEERAFGLVRGGRRGDAHELLFSTEYEAQKRIYAAGMASSNHVLMRRAEEKLATQRHVTVAGTAVLGLAVLVLVLVWWRVLRLVAERVRETETAERALAELNAALEDKVRERTAALLRANDTLGQEMRLRLQMEAELRQAQKLEAVGRLASGMAHEINTPVQFVSDSVHFLRDAARDLTDVIEKLQVVSRSVLAGTPSREAAVEAADAEQTADLPYLLENVPTALDRSLDGLGRVASIVRSMKEFAHPGSREMTAVDLNHAIENTLTIASNECRYVADVDTDLGELPPVTCHAGEVNQVILNLVINAAAAIGEVVAGSGARGRISVTTRRDGGDALIAIRDTGGGIPESIRERVFDPFFTTKEVGKGSGQGLSIARSVVVDKHGGSLSFESEVGAGTTFLIRLPIDGNPAAAAA